MNHWIFDFDGVLARSIENEIQLHKDFHGWKYSDEEIKQRIIDYFSKTELSKKNNVTQELIDYKKEFIQRYTNHVLSVENDIFHEFIQTSISIQPSRFAVVSSGGERYINTILEPYKDHFEYVYGMETHHSKEEKVERIAKHWQIDPTKIRYYTDTIADVLELQDLIGLENIFGCSWGWCGKDNLTTVLPEHQILNDFQDIVTK
jgi:phosphoserine phosphatase